MDEADSMTGRRGAAGGSTNVSRRPAACATMRPLNSRGAVQRAHYTIRETAVSTDTAR